MGLENAESKTIVLVDGPNMIHRAWHAVLMSGKAMTAPDGRPTGALTAYCNMLLRVRGLFPGAVFSTSWESRKSVRKERFAGYKANRPPTPDGLREQIQMGAKMSGLMGMPAIVSEGYEADDTLCALAAKGHEMGWRVVIASGDKDMGQAVTDRVSLWHPSSKTADLLGEAYVMEKFGVPPRLVAQWLALVGDESDNIPGVEKVGEKTASKLLLKHGSIDAILAASGGFSKKLKESFEKARETLPIALDLATAKLDCPLPMGIEEIAGARADWDAAIGVARSLGMAGIERKLEGIASAARKAEIEAMPAGTQMKLPI